MRRRASTFCSIVFLQRVARELNSAMKSWNCRLFIFSMSNFRLASWVRSTVSYWRLSEAKTASVVRQYHNSGSLGCSVMVLKYSRVRSRASLASNPAMCWIFRNSELKIRLSTVKQRLICDRQLTYSSWRFVMFFSVPEKVFGSFVSLLPLLLLLAVSAVKADSLNAVF